MWILEFLSYYTTTPAYLHTMSDDAMFYCIIGGFTVIVGAVAVGICKIIGWIKSLKG